MGFNRRGINDQMCSQLHQIRQIKESHTRNHTSGDICNQGELLRYYGVQLSITNESELAFMTEVHAP